MVGGSQSHKKKLALMVMNLQSLQSQVSPRHRGSLTPPTEIIKWRIDPAAPGMGYMNASSILKITMLKLENEIKWLEYIIQLGEKDVEPSFRDFEDFHQAGVSGKSFVHSLNNYIHSLLRSDVSGWF